VTDNLARNYPAAIPGLFNVGLLHTALTGRDGHEKYAPCTEQELAALGYDYWALGHVHKREEVSKEPYIVFPGNIQGRHAKETGPKGCALITVRPGKTEVDYPALDVVRWAQIEVDASDVASLDEVCTLAQVEIDRAEAAAGDRLLAARIVVGGRSEAHAELWRDRERLGAELRGLAQGYDKVWLEKVRVTTSPPQLSGDPTVEGAGAGELVKGILHTARELRADGEALRKAIERSSVWSKLPAEARGRDRLDIADPQWCGQLLDEAADLLTALLEEGAA
jgi:exonuclease SbcD